MSTSPTIDPRPTLARTAWIVAAVALALLAVAAGAVYRQVAVGRLVFELEARAYSVAQRFRDTTWREVRSFALDAGDLDADALRTSPEGATIGRSLKALAEGLAVVETRIYARSGAVLYASDPARIGDTATGPVVVQMLTDGYYGRGRADTVSMLDRASSRTSARVVTTSVALRNEGTQVKEDAVVVAPYEVLAVLEISQDATAEMRRVTRTTAIVVALPIATFGLILAYAGVRQNRRQKGDLP